MRLGKLKWIGIVFRYFDWLMRTLSLLVGAFSKADPARFPEFLQAGIGYLQKGWILPAVLITTPAAVWLRNKTDRSKLDSIHALLDQFCDHTFKNQKFDHEQNRRVTLFKYQYFTIRRWPCFGGWLIPIERSGEFTRNTTAIFRAPDDGEKCEGVAGRVWSKGTTVYVPNLPNLRSSPSEIQFSDYAEKSFVSVKKLKKKPPQACSLFGIRIEVKQKPWGVIVIDSVNQSIPHDSFRRCFKLTAPTLSSYLRGV